MTLNGFLHALFIIHSQGVIWTLKFYAITLKERGHFLIASFRKMKILLPLCWDTYPCSVLRIRDVYPGSRILILPIPDPGSRIPDLGSQIQKQQWKPEVKKNFLSYLFFGAIKFTKLNYFIFEMLKKKIWANFQRITV